MSVIQNYRDNTLSLWKDFLADKNRPDESSSVVASWLRCREARVNPYKDDIHCGLDQAAFRVVLNDKQELIKIAKPFMANLYKFVQGSGFVVVLTNEDGYLIEIFGDEDMLKNPMTRSFFKGASWREEEAGTNAIGTALVIKKPIQISGAEHYCQQHHCLTCSAAPILDKSGKVIGILNMSGACYMSHQHTLGMVVAAAEAIMAQIAIQEKNKELALISNRLTNVFNTMTDGVLIIDDQCRISQINPVAKKILNGDEPEIIGASIERIFGGKAALTRRMVNEGKPYEDIELIVDTKKGIVHCFASGTPLNDDRGEVIGGVIILRPIKQIQNLVNRFSGYSAALQFSDIVGESVELQEAIRAAELAAQTFSNILLQGESGTGKEIFAQAIHNKSKQRQGPFVALNCGVIPRELIGSELFGYVEGAFTGAKKGGKAGKFELAADGTIFLDEIGDMPLEQQVALLRVLQEKQIMRIASDKVIPINVRVICATNKNLLQEVERGTFRQDLYYRLNVISITLPPLRSRPRDIPLLFKHFLDRIARDRGVFFQIQDEVLECLQLAPWRGNVRELQNVVERAASMADSGIITLQHLPAELLKQPTPEFQAAFKPFYAAEIRGNGSRRQWRQLVGEAECQRILSLLARYGGNVSVVAKEMEISRNTLYRKMKQYHIENS